jgi:hypothetical protein
VEWRGARRGDRPAAELLHPLTPLGGGGVAVGGTLNSVERGDPSTTGVSRELGGLAENWGVSRELGKLL